MTDKTQYFVLFHTDCNSDKENYFLVAVMNLLMKLNGKLTAIA